MRAGAGPSALLGAAAIRPRSRSSPLAFEPNVGQASVDVRYVSLAPCRRLGRRRVRDRQYEGFPHDTRREDPVELGHGASSLDTRGSGAHDPRSERHSG
jgi:hypothetical protein